MALEALTQQDQLDARFARAFSPIDRLGAIPVSIAELNLARQRDETARLQKQFETVQEQTYRTGENKAYREYARETMKEQQAGIDSRNEKLEKLRRETELEERKINTETYDDLRNQKRELEAKISEAYQIPMEVRNRNARSVAEASGADKKVLDQFFNLKSGTDNSANFSKIPKADVRFLQQDLDGLNNGYLLPKVALAKAWQGELDDIQRGLNSLVHRIDLRRSVNKPEVNEAQKGASAGPAPDPLAELRARVAARNASAAKAVQAEATPVPNTALGIPPLNQISKGIGSVISQVGQDISDINPARGLGNALEHIVTGAPVRLDTPEEQARRDSIFKMIADREGYGANDPWNAAVRVPQVATPPAMPRFPSVSPAGPFGLPLNDSEIPGLKMLLKEGVNGQVFGDDQIALFFNEARRNPSGMQMKAIQMLREKLMKRSAGLPDVPSEAAPYGGPSNLFSPVPALKDFVFPITPLPR